MDKSEENRPERKIRFIKSAAETKNSGSAADAEEPTGPSFDFFDFILRGEALRRQMDSDAKEAAQQDKKAKEEREKEKLIEEIKCLKQNRKIKKKFSDQVINYLWWFSFGCLVIIFFEGFSPKLDIHLNHSNLYNFEIRLGGFHIDDTPLTTLIGSTAVSAIGLVAIVLRGLFNSKEEKSDEKPKSEDKKSS
ncbi:hypothetical protein APT_00780 [Acetobacter pasteurianus NBRC 101655]|uniref:hypothetical protein n=1 Tax=Acetobacter pasteurianus TaxID=438 RepID=UPI0002457342|nr:hypothetical protein [Acetobacter pasteurianus]BAU37862.1 hypothetical protein APT_00780 [Acetobacter pasteurianus NBRC 101655]